MSKTVRFKLSGKEANYVTGTINSIRSYGVDLPGMSEMAKRALMETCFSLNKRVNEAKEKLLSQQKEGEKKDGSAVDSTEGAGVDAGSERASDSNNAEEEQKDTPTQET